MAEPQWYHKSYRRNLVDMHIDDWDESFLSRLDPQAYVECLKRARVQSAMVYANSHVGLCYWPTRTGQMHRGLKGRDILREIERLCHAAGMDVVVYYSLIFNNWAYERQPSWRVLDSEGSGSRQRFGRLARYGTCCPNNAGYRALVESQVREIAAGYLFEGFFFDMMFWPGVCYCPACRDRFNREVGGEMPTIVNWDDAHWRAFQTKREEWLVEFADWTRRIAKDCAPHASVEYNSALLPQPWTLGTTLGLAAQNDYVGGDLYGGFHEQSFICKLYHSITPDKPFEFMTSRCEPDLRDHTTLKPKETLVVHAYVALAHGGAFLFIDAIDPVGTLNPRVYETMGEIFGRTKEYEPFLGGELCQDVAVYFSLDSKMDPQDNGKHVSGGTWNMPHRDAALGASRALREHHIPFGVISAGNLSDASQHQVIVLPNVLVLSGTEAEALRRFVADGGGLYASGRAAAEALPDVFGVRAEGRTAETVTYMAPAGRGVDILKDADARFPLTIRGPQVKAKAVDAGDVVATLTMPYSDPADGQRFASIHSDPPGMSTEYASLILRCYGKGRAVWAAAPIEAAEGGPHKRAFVQAVRALAAAPFSFEVGAPAAVEVTLFRQPAEKRYLVNVVNQQEQTPAIPVHDVLVRVRTAGQQVSGAFVLPERRPVAWAVKGEYAEVLVPRLDDFCMLAISHE